MIQNNNISSALSAYQNALSRVSEKVAPVAEAQQQDETSFMDLVKSGLETAVNAQSQAEQLTMAGIAGKADIQDVVLAVSNAEVALNTVVAVRDSAIKAYQQILQLPI